MTAQIKNPYVAKAAIYGKGYNVLFRYLIAGKIHFGHICACHGDHAEYHAKKIAKLLNDNEGE